MRPSDRASLEHALQLLIDQAKQRIVQTGSMVFVRQALLDGSVNALLTLRVGCLTSRYCATMTALDRGSIRRAATAEAVSLLHEVIVNSAGTVSAAIWEAAKRSRVGEVATAISRVVDGAMDTVSMTVSEAAETVTTAVKKGQALNPFRERPATAEEAHEEGSSLPERRDPTEPQGGPLNAGTVDATH